MPEWKVNALAGAKRSDASPLSPDAGDLAEPVAPVP
jgi:hypothetical protein